MKIAVIGAGGFVGDRVARRLAADPGVDRLVLLDRAFQAPPAGPRIVSMTGDFADPGVRAPVIDGADAVIVLAAVLGGAAESDPALARRVNIDATLDLFEDLRRRNPGTRVVFASTIAAFSAPMPNPVTDALRPAPTMIYGAHKVMVEVALTQYSARGWLDGVSLRPAGITARDGADAALKSAFMSRLFWCVKRGEDITLPVAEDSSAWMSSVDAVARNFIHAATLPALGTERAVTLPALTVRFGDLVRALHRQFPHSSARVRFAPDPDTIAMFGSYPRLETAAADRLGFVRDADLAALVRHSFPEESP